MSRPKKPDPVVAEVARVRSETAECTALAVYMAEAMARKIIECVCPVVWKKEVCWIDVKPAKGDERLVADCLRYIALRGGALPYRLIRKGNLVRFVEVRS